MKKLTNLIYITVLMVALGGLEGCSVIPDKPPAKPTQEAPSPELSTLDVGLSASYDVIQRELNSAVPNQLYWVTGQPVDHCPVSECSFQVRVLRNGPITVSDNGSGKLVVSIPVRTADGRVDAMKRVFGARIRKHADFNAAVTGTATISFAIDRNWDALADADFAFSVQSAEVHIGFPGGSVGISVRSKMSSLLDGQKTRLKSIVQSALAGKLNFKHLAEDAWNKLHGAHKLYDAPALWLVTDPVGVRVQNPVATSGRLKVAVGIDSYLSTHAQEEQPRAPIPEALPPLKIEPSINGHYKLSLPIQVTTSTINKLLETLDGREFKFEAKDKTVNAKFVKGRVYTNGPDLLVYAEVRAEKVLLGFIPIHVGAYFNGTPQYSKSDRLLYVDPFDYDADTNLLLLDKAEWFFHGKIREKLQEIIRVSIGAELDQAKEKLNDKLRELPLGQDVVLKGTVDEIGPRTIYTTKKTLSVDALATGGVHVEVK